MNIISNFIFSCDNCDANRVFVKFRESTVAAPRSGLLSVKFTFKGTSPPIIFQRIDIQWMPLTVFTQRNF